MAFVFWDVHGILFIDYFEKGKIINIDYYMALLDRLSAEIKKKRPHMQRKKVLFNQYNLPCQKSNAIMTNLHELYFELLPHPAYSLDLAPSGYYLFADLKILLQGKRFGSNEKVIARLSPIFRAKTNHSTLRDFSLE